MSQPRRAKRRDVSHNVIRGGLEMCGYWTSDTADLGSGFPDILCVSKTRIVVLLEVKSKNGVFTDDERIFFRDYPGPKAVVFDLEGAVEIMCYYDGMEMVCK